MRSSARWRWQPSRAFPRLPRSGGTAPQGDIGELIQHLGRIRRQGAAIADAEQAWAEGMRLIDQRASQVSGGSVVNDFFGVVDGDWRVYMGRPALRGGDTFALAFNVRSGAIMQGLLSGIRAHPTQPGELALFNFASVYP